MNTMRFFSTAGKLSSLIGAGVTGETPFYSSMMQEWAQQYYDDRSIEGYCIDAPEYIPSGETKALNMNSVRTAIACTIRRGA